MKDTRSIEEQVAELTEKQKDTVVKVGIWGIIILLVITLPLLLLFVLGAITFLIVIVYLIIIKTVFPYYSDKKAQYIMKSRKRK